MDLHPQEHKIQLFTDASNLEQNSIKGLWSDLEKSLQTVFLALKHFKSPCKSNSPSCLRHLNSSSLNQHTGQNSLSRKVHLSVENCELASLIQISLHARHIPMCLNVIVDSLSRLNQIQSTDGSPLLPHVFKRICQKWFIHRWTCLPQVATVFDSSTK